MKRIAIVLLSAALAVTGCDRLPEQVPTEFANVAEPAAGEGQTCNDELRELVSVKAETLRCHAECADLFVECLEQEAPECFYCEHEAAICRSTCNEPALWAVL